MGARPALRRLARHLRWGQYWLNYFHKTEDNQRRKFEEIKLFYGIIQLFVSRRCVFEGLSSSSSSSHQSCRVTLAATTRRTEQRGMADRIRIGGADDSDAGGNGNGNGNGGSRRHVPTALFLACAAGASLEEVAEVFAAAPSAAVGTDGHRRTPLFAASSSPA